MKIIICGAGEVGFSLAKYLSSENILEIYNEALEMYSRTTERYHFNEKLSTSSN